VLQETCKTSQPSSPNAAQLGEGNANIAYELGRLHLIPPDQFVGGDVQTYYEQGYNYQDYECQPPAED
jgi:hypothetical protein